MKLGDEILNLKLHQLIRGSALPMDFNGCNVCRKVVDEISSCLEKIEKRSGMKFIIVEKHEDEIINKNIDVGTNTETCMKNEYCNTDIIERIDFGQTHNGNIQFDKESQTEIEKKEMRLLAAEVQSCYQVSSNCAGQIFSTIMHQQLPF